MFNVAFLTEVAKLILTSLDKSCELDHIPTFLLKSCLCTLIVSITDLINASSISGVFPSHFKHAHVNHLLKKTYLPANDLNSHRPISNLSFISKVFVKGVSCRLNIHLSCNHLSNVFQSAYKQFNSPEACLLVHSDISLNICTLKRSQY